MASRSWKKAVLTAVFSTFIATQMSGCSATATTLVSLAVGDNIARGVKANRYFRINRISKIRDIDLHKTKSTDISAEQIAFVKNGGILRILPEEQQLKPINNAELNELSQPGIRIDAETKLPFRYYIIVSLNSSEEDLREVLEVAKVRKAVVLVRGLKNDSLADTFVAAKPFTEQNIPVLLAPIKAAKWNINISPFFVSGHELPNGQLRCPEGYPKKCNAFKEAVGAANKQAALDL